MEYISIHGYPRDLRRDLRGERHPLLALESTVYDSNDFKMALRSMFFQTK